MSKPIRILTRDSYLAMAQTLQVSSFLMERGIEPVVTAKKTHGDVKLDAPLYEIGNPKEKEGKAFFTKELEDGLLENDGDLAVHSLKDLPTQLPEGLNFAAAIMEEERGDTLVSVTPLPKTSDSPGAVKQWLQTKRLGTSSLRRIALLKEWLGEPEIVPVRGNLITRMEKLLRQDQMDVLVLATAGLKRLFAFQRYWSAERANWIKRLDETIVRKLDEETARLNEIQKNDLYFYSFDEEIFLPAVSQGVLGLECRSGEREFIRNAFAPKPEVEQRIELERGILSRLEAGCHVPFGLKAEKVTAPDAKNNQTENSINHYRVRFYHALGFDPDRPYDETPYRAVRNFPEDFQSPAFAETMRLVSQEALGKKFPVRFCGKNGKPVSEIFRKSGHEFVQMPLIQTKPLDLKNTGMQKEYLAGVVVSQTVCQYWPESAPEAERWVAVGEKTAACLQEKLGLQPDLPASPEEYNGEGAARLIIGTYGQMPDEEKRTKNILWLGAKNGQTAGVELLQDNGFQVDVTELYETQPVYHDVYFQNEQEKEDFLSEDAWWVFTSPSSAEAYFNQGLLRGNHLHAVIGETTAQVFYEKDLLPHFISSEASLQQMALGICGRFEVEQMTLTPWNDKGNDEGNDESGSL